MTGKTWVKVVSVALVAVLLALAFGGTSTANAQAGTQQLQGAGKMVAQALLDAAIQVTGLERNVIVKEMADGKSLAEVIKAHNADVEAVKAAAKVTLSADITKAVTDGTLTQAQADKMTANLDTVLDKALNRVPKLGKTNLQARILKAGGLSILFGQTAKATNLSQRDLLQELRDGKTLTQIATAHNADPAKIVSAAVNEATKRVNVLVKNGKVNQADADKLIASLPAYFNTAMNTVDPLNGKNARKGSNGSNNPQTTPMPTLAPTGVATAIATPSL